MTSISRRQKRKSKRGRNNTHTKRQKAILHTYFNYNPITGLNYYSGLQYIN